MYFKTTYDSDFDDLYMHLKAKYPQKLFDLDGIGKQLDMSEFSRNFFSSKVTADASIDSNANVDDVSVIAYNTELPKPFFRINSYYILWKELKRLYGLEIANKVVEMNLIGDIYINDFHGIGAGMPYSYFGKTVLILKINNNIKYTTIENFFDLLSKENNIIKKEDAEEIQLNNVQILDENNKWVNVSRILKHKSHTNLVELETKNGKTTIVTLDHPVITDNGDVTANKLTLSDSLKLSNSNIDFKDNMIKNNCYVDKDYAYFIGFLLGDGFIYKTTEETQDGTPRHMFFTICQKDVVNTKIFNIVNKFFDNVKVVKNGNEIRFGYKKDCLTLEKLLIGYGSRNKALPVDILNWSTDEIKSLICGLIDSDGTVEKNGNISIRTNSFALTQQVAEILNFLNCGRVRTSFCGKYHSKSGYEPNYEIYRMSVRLTDKEFLNYSVKINDNKELVYKEIGKDGRWETNQLHKIIEIPTEEYVYDITTDSGHFHCQGLIQHNCFNYSTYDIHMNGLPMVKKIKSVPPKYLYSFKSQLEQFTVIASNSTLGATGLADLLVVMSYYVNNILKTKSDAGFKFATEEDCWKYVEENLVSFIYTINQPMRANQSPFTNISIYDDYFLDSMCDDYIFIDGSSPDKEIIKKLQKLYLDVMNKELTRTPITFPVTTACFSIDENKEIKDREFLEFIAKENQEYGFINIYCGDSATLSSCCRLRSDRKNEYFNSFGSGSSKIGSLGVCTINLPRLAIKYKNKEEFFKELKGMVEICAKVNNAKRKIVEKRIKNGNEPLYSLGFMDLNKQYSTCGVCGFNECISYLGEDILDDNGINLGLEIINAINEANDKLQKQYNAPHNCEQIPAENVAIKLASKDKLLGYQDECSLYSNQFIPLIKNADLLDRIKLQGIFDSHFSGGAICHLNCDQKIEDYHSIMDLIETTAKKGVIYFAINYVLSECEDGHMTVGNENICSICGKPIINNYTRVVGFLTNIKNWHKVRREEDFPNRQFYHGV